MSDILSSVLKINQPVSSGVDNHSSRNSPIVPSDPQIQNIVDPSKVVRPDGKGEAEQKQFFFHTESNYANFVQMLKDMPQLTELFSKLIFTDFQNIFTSGLSENFAEELAGFMKMMKMDPEQLLSFIKGQEAGSGQFGGIFFQAMRDILNTTGSVELKAGILDFLKHYSNMASAPHLLNNIQTAVNEIIPYLFKADAEQLQEIMNHLVFTPDEEAAAQGQEAGGEAGQKAEAFSGQEGKNFLPQAQEGKASLLQNMDAEILMNSKVLKEELIPFFSKYVSRTHDLGRPRELMTLVTMNTARYCKGTKDEVIQCFEKLLKFGEFSRKLGDIKEENLEIILNKLLTERKDGEKNPWTEKFISLLKSGLQGEGGYENKLVFQNVLNAMLLNESVYMPLMHLMLPLDLNGNIMFSEMWIDPDAEGEDGSRDEEERNIRMLIKFDIKDLGYFDLVMNYRGGNMDMVLCYPPRLAAAEQEIKTGIGRIIQDNGLTFQSLELEQSRTPLPLASVFPKIIEGRNSINVRI